MFSDWIDSCLDAGRMVLMVRELRFAIVNGAVNVLAEDMRWYGGGERVVKK